MRHSLSSSLFSLTDSWRSYCDSSVVLGSSSSTFFTSLRHSSALFGVHLSVLSSSQGGFSVIFVIVNWRDRLLGLISKSSVDDFSKILYNHGPGSLKCGDVLVFDRMT